MFVLILTIAKVKGIDRLLSSAPAVPRSEDAANRWFKLRISYDPTFLSRKTLRPQGVV